jgi:hypothetical protein
MTLVVDQGRCSGGWGLTWRCGPCWRSASGCG